MPALVIGELKALAEDGVTPLMVRAGQVEAAVLRAEANARFGVGAIVARVALLFAGGGPARRSSSALALQDEGEGDFKL